MRSVNFRDGVLWPVAYKLGLDPEQGNFLTNQAIPIGTYINEWVRRLYEARDWPELVVTHRFVPTNHVVAWDDIARELLPDPGGKTVYLERILKVYLLDPLTTETPMDTPFQLKEDGVHVGYDHGFNVWISYIARAPNFTAVTWDPGATYERDDLVYAPVSGECYRSRSSGNTGRDPADATPRALHPVTVQEFGSGTPGTPGQPKIMRVDYSSISPTPSVSGYTQVTAIVTEAGVTITSQVHTVITADTRDTIFADLRTKLDTALAASYTVTQDAPTNTMTLSNTAGDFVLYIIVSTFGPSFYVPVSQVQAYLPPIPGLPLQRQLTDLTLGSTEVFQSATYTLTMIDSINREHIVDYVAQQYDDGNAILHGLMQAIIDISVIDAWMLTVYSSLDTTSVTMELSFAEQVSVDAYFDPSSTRWWEVVPFPKVLADQVIRGAYADLLKEWGQTDKGTSEEGAVPTETSIREAAFATMPNPPLSGQQAPLSRYKA